eukprot:4598907-Prymnesium_polylepis.1
MNCCPHCPPSSCGSRRAEPTSCRGSHDVARDGCHVPRRRWARQHAAQHHLHPVSYTHLTLPTICSV